MKKNDLYEVGAGVAVIALGYALYKHFYYIKPDPNRNKQAQYAGTKKVSVDQATANGWQYFTDGTAIGPDGSYYMNDKLVWSPT